VFEEQVYVELAFQLADIHHFSVLFHASPVHDLHEGPSEDVVVETCQEVFDFDDHFPVEFGFAGLQFRYLLDGLDLFEESCAFEVELSVEDVVLGPGGNTAFLFALQFGGGVAQLVCQFAYLGLICAHIFGFDYDGADPVLELSVGNEFVDAGCVLIDSVEDEV
jgi:hypothetical protein